MNLLIINPPTFENEVDAVDLNSALDEIDTSLAEEHQVKYERIWGQ